MAATSHTFWDDLARDLRDPGFARNFARKLVGITASDQPTSATGATGRVSETTGVAGASHGTRGCTG